MYYVSSASWSATRSAAMVVFTTLWIFYDFQEIGAYFF